jgi:hypothetical protein
MASDTACSQKFSLQISSANVPMPARAEPVAVNAATTRLNKVLIFIINLLIDDTIASPDRVAGLLECC